MAGPTELPEPEARRRVFAVVLDYPGLRLVEVAREAGLGATLVEYHLEALRDADLVVDATYEGHRRFFPVAGPGAPSVADAEWLALLREPMPLRLALLLLDAGVPLSHTVLHRKVEVAKSTLSFHLGKMVAVGLLERDPEGAYAPSDRDRLHRLVVAHRPVPRLLAEHFALWVARYRSAARISG